MSIRKRPITIDVDERRPPKRSRGSSSILIAETKLMERARRLAEQQGERKLAAVKARDHGLLRRCIAGKSSSLVRMYSNAPDDGSVHQPDPLGDPPMVWACMIGDLEVSS